MKLNVNEGNYETRDNITEKIITSYKYGSHVYGSHSEHSDYDYIVVVESDDPNLNYSVNWKGVDYTVYGEQKFIKLIEEHQVSVLECIFQKGDNEPYLKYFKLDTEKLRRSFSAVSSNSYVKCKKKIRDGEIRTGLKSLYHSLRILNFGIQIARYGKILDYTSANVFLNQIYDIGPDWDILHEKFKPIHNMLKTHFKKIAPLQSEINK